MNIVIMIMVIMIMITIFVGRVSSVVITSTAEPGFESLPAVSKLWQFRSFHVASNHLTV